MGQEDRAILVGISRYSDRTFAPLNGPPNDVDRMHAWLTDARGGDVPAANIIRVTSPASHAATLDPEDWDPTEHDFQKAYRRTVTDPGTSQPVRRNSRLYMYFSGHGFSERRDQATQASIFAANATRFFANNICGTVFALAAREQALFGEIVLIMDCCRDAELNLPLSRPPINTATADAASGVRFMALYAAPKGGKAQERPFAELNGMTCGLLTHAFLRSLMQTPPDDPKGVSSTAIKRYLLSTWAEVCGDTPAPEPEFVSPTGADIFFPAVAQGVSQTFRLTVPPAAQITFDVLRPDRAPIVRCEINPASATMTPAGQAPAALVTTDGGTRFVLQLQPGLYRYTLSGDRQASGVFDATGVQDVDL